MKKFPHQSAAARRTHKNTKSPIRARDNSNTGNVEIVELKKTVLQLQQQLLQQELQDKAEIHQLTTKILSVDLSIKQLQLEKIQQGCDSD